MVGKCAFLISDLTTLFRCPRSKKLVVEQSKHGFIGEFLLRVAICEAALKVALREVDLEAEADLFDSDEVSLDEVLTTIRASIVDIDLEYDRRDVKSKLEDLLCVILEDDVQIFIGCLRRVGAPSKTVGIILINETSQKDRTADEFRRGYPAGAWAAVLKVAYATVIQNDVPKTEADVLKILNSTVAPTFETFLDLARNEIKAVIKPHFSFSARLLFVSSLCPSPSLSLPSIFIPLFLGVWIPWRPSKISEICANFKIVLL